MTEKATSSTPQTDVEVVEGRDIVIIFNSKLCIHSRFCVTEAPNVFLANTPGAWILPDAMDVEKLVAVAERCPSGAVRYRRKDGHAQETPPPVNLLHIRENGPNAVHADLYLKDQAIGTRATLCRCGMSKNKPFCDNSHIAANFVATGEPKEGDIAPLAVRDGPLKINPQPDGPNAIEGNLEICTGTGHPVARVVSTYLCRCGGSGHKPFCDGTHQKIGFKAP